MLMQFLLSASRACWIYPRNKIRVALSGLADILVRPVGRFGKVGRSADQLGVWCGAETQPAKSDMLLLLGALVASSLASSSTQSGYTPDTTQLGHQRNVHESSSPGCRDSSNSAVDWWVLIKYPQGYDYVQYSEGSFVAGGTLEDKSSPLAYTLATLYANTR